MRNITRFDYGNSHGWWVRFYRGGKLAVGKFFSDGANGGKTRALQTAKAFRDTAEETVPSPAVRVQPRGTGRVYREERSYRNARGELIRYKAWSFWVRLADGRASHTSYSIEKHGTRKAQAMAKAALEQARSSRAGTNRAGTGRARN
jgi:hypothetical protein